MTEDMTDRELADWVVTLCLMFGTAVATAYQVAGLFVGGVTAQHATSGLRETQC